ncbi:polysaccharide biosynthesis tyrosine autokinase [Mycolicibacterium aichiense]|uniref:polysaccharide biosynthesis tyrosine autokinase n=1 Tax=Mycolicibacterium aichiense TaxID=1799 RepID=UPI0021F32346|nr:polysaccharide biosynthesis tyrosine autokinase [Mycolicibacterium aichiense]
MDLRSYCRVLVRRWPVLMSVFVLVGAAVAGVGFLVPETFTANARIVFTPNLSVDTEMQTRQVAQLYLADRMKTYAQVVTTNQVLQPVIDSLSLGVTVPELVKRTEVTIPTGTQVIDVAVSAPTGEEAAATANRIANAMPFAVAGLEGAASVAASPIQVSVLQPAQIPSFHTTPNVTLNLIVAAGLAFIAAIFAAVLVDNFDTRVRRRRDVTALGATYLGGIPAGRRTKAKDSQVSTQAPDREAIFRRIAIDVLHAVDETPTRLVFTSPRMGVDKTMVAANIAGALAEAGNHVVFIDADVRGRRLASQVGIKQSPGITDLVSGRNELDESFFESTWRGFTIIPCGGSAIDAGEMLASEKFGEVMRDLAGYFDVIIVDAPPITNLSEGSLFTQNIKDVVVVAEAVNTRRKEFLLATNSLRHAGAKILGVVLSRVRKDEQSAPAEEKDRNDEATSDR